MRSRDSLSQTRSHRLTCYVPDLSERMSELPEESRMSGFHAAPGTLQLIVRFRCLDRTESLTDRLKMPSVVHRISEFVGRPQELRIEMLFSVSEDTKLSCMSRLAFL